jgi:hypothetical protein
MVNYMHPASINPVNPEHLGAPSGNPIKRPARRIGEKSREGGRASHESGKGHRFSTEEARAAGRKGGQISRRGKKKPDSSKG